jgi:ubiquinone/menaquinone biosynthesis C-methylase UbiE
MRALNWFRQKRQDFIPTAKRTVSAGAATAAPMTIEATEPPRRSQWDTTSDAPESSEAYWTRINVTDHYQFKSRKESIEYFEWRNMLYSNYIESMPVAGYDGKVVLDFGCGPGHDLVGFAEFSKPQRLIGMDVSRSSLAESRQRMALHSDDVELILISEKDTRLPLEDSTVDVIHSSGVLHHTPDPAAILREFRRIIRPNGITQIMVYNYNSVFVHLGIAYQKIVVDKQFADMTLAEAFQRSTDGPECPISRYYWPEEFTACANGAGFDCLLRGVGVSYWEMQLLPLRFEALCNRVLPHESRKFLYALTFDDRGRPVYGGHLAGIDACFLLTPR